MTSIGTISWVDLTVNDAEEIRDFYASVAGWKPAPVDMGGYADYNMTGPDDDTPHAGICHARGDNMGIPPKWIVYINVRDLDNSMAACVERGGKVLGSVRSMGVHGRYCFIEDPAGAVAALFEPAGSSS